LHVETGARLQDGTYDQADRDGNRRRQKVNAKRFGAMSLSLLKFAGQASLVDEVMLPS
jgi:hypothetical protein